MWLGDWHSERGQCRLLNYPGQVADLRQPRSLRAGIGVSGSNGGYIMGSLRALEQLTHHLYKHCVAQWISGPLRCAAMRDCYNHKVHCTSSLRIMTAHEQLFTKELNHWFLTGEEIPGKKTKRTTKTQTLLHDLFFPGIVEGEVFSQFSPRHNAFIQQEQI